MTCAAYFRELGEYEYRSAYEVAAVMDEAQEVHVIDVDTCVVPMDFHTCITMRDWTQRPSDGRAGTSDAGREIDCECARGCSGLSFPRGVGFVLPAPNRLPGLPHALRLPKARVTGRLAANKNE